MLYREAQALLRQAEDVRVLVRRVDAGLRGRLRIGFVGSMLYRGLPALLAAMRAELPEVEHVLAELNSHDQIEAVHRGELDLGFIHANPLPEGVQAQDRWRNPSSSACRPAMRWRGAGLALVELAGEDFVFFARAASPSYYETVLSLCVTAGFTPLVRHEVRHWLSVAALVSQGLGWRSCRPACRAALAALHRLRARGALGQSGDLAGRGRTPLQESAMRLVMARMPTLRPEAG